VARRAVRLEAIGRAGSVSARAGLGGVALARCRPTGRAGGHEAVGGTGVAHPVAALGHVAGAGRRAARRRALRIRRAGCIRAGAALHRVAGARRGAADRAGIPRRVLAGVGDAVARVGRARVAVVGARGAARLLGIGRAARPIARAELRHVARARPRAADLGGQREGIGGTIIAHPVTALGHVAGTGRRPALRRALRIRRAGRARAGAALPQVAGARRGAADRAGIPRRVLAGVGDAVARVGRARVAVVGARRAARLLGIGRAARPIARAELRHVARARPRAADLGGRREGIGGTIIAHPVTALGHVAGAGRRPALRRALRIRRAGRARAGAALPQVAGARRGAADRAGIPRRVLAGVGDAVARVGRARVAVVGARRAARLLGIGRAARPIARAELRHVARARPRAADLGGRREGIGGTIIAHPVTALGHVAGAGRRPALRRALRIRRAGRARAGAALPQVAGARRGAADRAGIPRRVLAGVGDAVARVGRARVAVVGARGAARLLGIGRAARPIARAELRHVARARPRAADLGGQREGIGGTIIAHPVTALGHVAGTGRRPALRRALRIRRAGRARAGAALPQVADARRGAADRAGIPRRVLAGVVRAVAGVGRARVAVVGARGAARLLGIGRAARPIARAELRHVARARPRAADLGGRREGIGGTIIAHPVTALGHVAGTGRRAALRRALRIRRAGRIRAGAALRQVTDARRRPALHRRRLEGVGGA